MELNIYQKEAVDCLNSNLQIVACPGTGKTEVVARRIVNLISHGVAPSEIVAFTFTKKAAKNMKDRILKNLEERSLSIDITELFVGTIHAFCSELLHHVADKDNFFILDTCKEHLFLGKNLKRSGMEDLGLKGGYNNIKLFCECIDKMVYEYPGFHSWSERDKNVFLKYKELLETYNYTTYSFLMHDVLEVINTNESAYKFISSIKHLIVDEYQDVDDLQERLIESIAAAGAFVCVVGDDDQTIYQFRGSNAQNMINFAKKYKDVQVINLNTNYRSTKAVVDVAKVVIKNNKNRLDKNMIACEIATRGEVNCVEADNVINEYTSIANQIQVLHEKEIPYSETAILIRSRRNLGKILQVLEENGIPYNIEGTIAFFASKDFQMFNSIFEYLRDSSSNNKMLLKELWEHTVDLRKLKAGMRGLQRINGSNVLFKKVFQNFIETVEYNITGKQSSFIRIYETILGDFDTIYGGTEWSYRLEGVVFYLENIAKQEYKYVSVLEEEVDDAVNIMTVHKAKGLEFAAVFLPDITIGSFPPKVRSTKKYYDVLDDYFVEVKEKYDSGIEDERKLFYVALTRAKEYLFILSGKKSLEKSPFFLEVERSSFARNIEQSISIKSSQPLNSIDSDTNSMALNKPVAYSGNRPFIFISYAHKDANQVFPIIKRMQEDGYNVWYDEGIRLGDPWGKSLANHIEECSVFLPLISENFIASENCLDELAMAKAEGRRILLFYLRNVKLPSELRLGFNRFQALYKDGLEENKVFRKLYSSLN